MVIARNVWLYNYVERQTDRPNAEVGPCLTRSINERQTRTDTPTSGVLKHTGRVEVCSIV